MWKRTAKRDFGAVERWVRQRLAVAHRTLRVEYRERPAVSVWTRLFGIRLERRARQPVLLPLTATAIVGVLGLMAVTLVGAVLPHALFTAVAIGTAAVSPFGSPPLGGGAGGFGGGSGAPPHVPFATVSIGGGTPPPAAGLALFNVKDYGALGGADDTIALKGCLDAIRTAGGGIMWFPPGIYRTSAQLYVPSNTVVQGAGRQACRIQRKSNSIANGDPNNTGATLVAGPTDGVLYTVGAHGTSISVLDITVDGNAAGNPGVTNANLGCHGIRFHFVDYVRLTSVELINCLSSGVYLWGCRRSASWGCIARSNGQIAVADSRNGFSVTGPQDDATDRDAQDEHIFIGCHALNNTDEGIAIGRNGRIVIQGCSIHDNGDMGIEGDSSTITADVTSVPAGWTITGCHIYSNGSYGIGLGNSNAQRVVVQGNVIEDNPGPGISASFTSGSLIVIENNLIRNFGTRGVNDHAIIVGGADRAVIGDNLLDAGVGTLASGIVFIAQPTARHLNVTGNLVSMLAGGQNGFSMNGMATGRIAGNVFHGTLAAFTDCISIAGGANGIDNLNIEDNLCLNAARYGILVRTTAAGNITNVRIRKNTCTDNQGGKTQQYGLATSEAGGGLITGMYIEDNDFEGNLTGRMLLAAAALPVGWPSKRPVALALNANVATDASAGDVFTLTDNAVGTARNIVNPTNLLEGQPISYRFSNTSGGALGVYTFGANFRLAGAWVQPATGNSRLLTCIVQGGVVRELSRTTADELN